MADGAALNGKAVIVTGAGRGIGREIALLAAAEGAKVVVNDLGGAADGSGKSSGPVEEVVELIRQKGGMAVPNFDTVAEPSAAAGIPSGEDGARSFSGKWATASSTAMPAFCAMQSFTRCKASLISERGDQSSSVRLVLCIARRRAALPRAGQRRFRAFHLDLRPGRQFRPSQLRRRQARHRRPIEVDRARHGTLQRALELCIALCLEPPYRYHSD